MIDICEIAMRHRIPDGYVAAGDFNWPAIQREVDAALYKLEAQAYDRCAAALEASGILP